jgi:group I intron endonuclease
MYGIIYKATGPSGLVYIGQTKNSLAHRKGQHAYMAKKGDERTAFQVSLLTLGFKSFAWEQIDTAETKLDLDQKERYWIAFYKSDNPAHGYNGTNGGIKTVYTTEARRKISETLKGKKRGPMPEATRRKLSEANKGQQPWNKGK